MIVSRGSAPFTGPSVSNGEMAVAALSITSVVLGVLALSSPSFVHVEAATPLQAGIGYGGISLGALGGIALAIRRISKKEEKPPETSKEPIHTRSQMPLRNSSNVVASPVQTPRRSLSETLKELVQTSRTEMPMPPQPPQTSPFVDRLDPQSLSVPSLSVPQTALLQSTEAIFPVGIPNVGNSCYINSILQCLFSLKTLREEMQKLHPDSTKQPVTFALKTIFEQLKTGEIISHD